MPIITPLRFLENMSIGIILFAAFALGIPCENIYGGMPQLESWAQESENGKYLLVMISPLSLEEDVNGSIENAENIKLIRNSYAVSGLYRNDGSTTPIWTKAYVDKSNITYISSDGVHLISADTDWENQGDHVVTFYSSGQRLSTYFVSDLIHCYIIKSFLNSCQNVSCSDITYSDDLHTFTVRTSQREEFTFDTTNGLLLHHNSPFPLLFALIALITLTGISIIIYRKMLRGMALKLS